MSKKFLEREFRLAVVDPTAFQLLDIQQRPRHTYKVIYAKPHFRYKHSRWEYKKVQSRVAIYHNGYWFKWVTSKEIPFRHWSRKLFSKFVDSVGLYQNPFQIEYRVEMELDDHAKIAAFRKGTEVGLLFEYETKSETLDVSPLNKYQDILNYLFRHKPAYPIHYTLKPCTRKPVKPMAGSMEKCMVAHKFDGVFGFVSSYPDKLVEMWEGNVHVVKRGLTLGDGFVFSAEKLETGPIVLLDVYQVRGVPTAYKRSIFMDFLPRLELPSGFQVQTYRSTRDQLPPTPWKTDGYIYHDVERNRIYKWKRKHTVDVVYWDGYFLTPNNQKFPYKKRPLENGQVYEVSMKGRVISKRADRFVGNSALQWENILKCGAVWKGPAFEPRDTVKSKKKKKKKNK